MATEEDITFCVSAGDTMLARYQSGYRERTDQYSNDILLPVKQLLTADLRDLAPGITRKRYIACCFATYSS